MIDLQTCRDCCTVLATHHGNQVCESCYTERINGAGIFEDDDLDPVFDDLFPETLPPPTPLARIVCVVCEKPAAIPVDADGRVCDLCRPEASRHIEARRAAAAGALTEAWRVWDATLAAAPPSDRDRWARVEAACGAPRFAEAWAVAKESGGTFAALLEAHEALQEISDACNRVFVWAERARREL